MRLTRVTLLAVLTGGGLAALRAAPPTGPTLAVLAQTADSVRLSARWSLPCDLRGCADSSRVTWTVSGAGNGATDAVVVLRTVGPRTTRATADTVTLARPRTGDTVQVTVTVVPVRRGQSGTARTATVALTTADAPPPPVDSLRVDTLPRADSGRVDVYAADGRLLPDPLVLAEGDSALLVSRIWMRAGVTRRATDTIAWGTVPTGTTPGVARIGRITGVYRDTAWLYAVSCNCRESGDTTNLPRLDVRSGAYVVRDARGGWRPVTRLAVDPLATRAP